MNEDIARRLIALLSEAALENGYEDAASAAEYLGVRGILERVSGGRLPARSRADLIWGRIWDDTLREAAASLHDVFRDAGVRYVVFKGGALLGAVYQPGDVRMTDLDVFVPLRDRDRVRAALGEAGLASRQPIGGPPLEGGPGGLFERALTQDAVSALLVDVHWRVVPVERLFPWKGVGLPDVVFAEAVSPVGVSIPRPGHHAALLVHHLVRHDLLHFRSAFDLMALWPDLSEGAESAAFFGMSSRFGVGRVAHWTAAMLSADLGVPPLAGMRPSGRPPRALTSVRRLIGLSLVAGERDFEAVTARRARRRLRIVDRPLRAAFGLLGDALAPPDTYLRWRWPRSSPLGRRVCHLARAFGRLAVDQPSARAPATNGG